MAASPPEKPKRRLQNATKSRTGKTPDRRSLAALLVAQDEHSDEHIAEQVGVSRQTLAKWKKLPEFAAEVERIRSRARAVVESHALGTVAGRMQAYEDRHRRMQQVIEERAAAGGDAPGAKSGLLVKSYKVVGTGEFATTVEEWATDGGLLKEMRELEKQISIEQGQWAEKQDITLGGSIIREYVISTESEIAPEVTD